MTSKQSFIYQAVVPVNRLHVHSTNKTHLHHDGRTLVFHTGEETIDTTDEMGEWELNQQL